MISFSFQPLLALSADEQAVLANPEVRWAAVLKRFAFGLLDTVSRGYHAAAREFNLRRRRGRAGRPRTRRSAEKKAAKARVEASAGLLISPNEYSVLGPKAHPATTGRSPKRVQPSICSPAATCDQICEYIPTRTPEPMVSPPLPSITQF